ncbi:hypothetical protein MBOURGENBZM_13600 [Methanoculleus bourgensis]|nr:hypothetical protein MBOURGENBZM_13600 [Methanoculleus bourgensis]
MGRSERLYRMKATYSPGESGQWTVVAIIPGGGGRGGRAPSPTGRTRGTNRAVIPPPAKPGRFSWEMLAEMLY